MSTRCNRGVDFSGLFVAGVVPVSILIITGLTSLNAVQSTQSELRVLK